VASIFLDLFFCSVELFIVLGIVLLIFLFGPFFFFYYGLGFSLVLSIFLHGAIVMLVVGMGIYSIYLIILPDIKLEKKQKEQKLRKKNEWEDLLEMADNYERQQ
jgi:hypothetical protein